MNKKNDQAYKLLVRVLKKVEAWREYEQVLCDAFNSLCGLTRRLSNVREGENDLDEAGSRYAVGVLVSWKGATHVLAQKLSMDIENNWRIISQQLSSMHALVINEIQKIETEAFNQFPSIPVGSIAIQGTGISISVSECVQWISQINKMLYGEYLRKREIFTQYSTGELTDPLSASLSWPACSNEGLVNEELLQEISDRISLVNQS